MKSTPHRSRWLVALSVLLVGLVVVILAVRALRGLLDDPDRTDWDELLAANRALCKAIAKNKPMTLNNARIVAEYLREAGWNEGAIGAAFWRDRRKIV
jgi:hypothetical protein